MPLKVIGAGMPRTGTMSLKLALEQLGYAPCHHMIEVFNRPNLPPLWARAFDGTLGDYEEIFKEFQATTDAPAAFVFDQLAARYPDAKVILSTRDAEKWYASMQATILTQTHQSDLASSPLAGMFQSMVAYVSKRGGPDQLQQTPSKNSMIAWFNSHNSRVEASIAPDRLLVFEASQGWEPLCAFLDRPVPSTPYPRVNDSQEFHQAAGQAVRGAS